MSLRRALGISHIARSHRVALVMPNASTASYFPACASGRRSFNSNSGRKQSKRRDYRGPLLVGGSLVGASTIQCYLHHRAFNSPTVLGPNQARNQLIVSASSVTAIGAAAAAALAFSSTSMAAASAAAPSPVTTALQASNAISPTQDLQSQPASLNPLEGLRITLYQYKICPFCCKVKAVLDFYKVPYETLDVNPLTKAEIKFSSDYRKVPIARLGQEVVRDSPVIVKRIADMLYAARVAPTRDLDVFFSPDAMRWAEWADKELAVLLFPNITRSFGESFQAFSYVNEVPHFSFLDKLSNQWVGATAMWAAQGKIKKKYNIADERTALFDALQRWTREVGEKPFLGGTQPNVGDLGVYACIHAIEGLDAFKDLMANTDISEWYTRVEHAIGASSCVRAE